MSSLCPQSTIAWAGRATSRRGRTSCYRVVVNSEALSAELARFADVTDARVDPRKLFTIERCGTDAMGELSWSSCGHSPPKSVILAMALELSRLAGIIDSLSVPKGGAA